MRKFVPLFLIPCLAIPTFAANTETITEPTDTPREVPVSIQVDAPTFSVTVPTLLPYALTAEGEAVVAEDVYFESSSGAPVKVSDIQMAPANEWAIKAWDAPLSAKEFAMKINDNVTTDGGFIWRDFILNSGDKIELTYDVQFLQGREALDVEVAKITFIVDWAPLATPANYFDISDGELTGLSSEGSAAITSPTDLVLPSSVTSIAANAFSGNTNITSITVNAECTTIADDAFAGMDNLTEINMMSAADSVTGAPWGSTATVQWLG